LNEIVFQVSSLKAHKTRASNDKGQLVEVNEWWCHMVLLGVARIAIGSAVPLITQLVTSLANEPSMAPHVLCVCHQNALLQIP
jgi:hypothetical protein